MSEGPFLRFGVFELDLESAELRKEGRLLRLQPQAVKLLTCLARRTGRVVSREELARELWGDEGPADVERALSSCVLLVRTALGDDAQTPRYVRTLPRRGYQFIAPVEAGGAAPSGPAGSNASLAGAVESPASAPPATPAPSRLAVSRALPLAAFGAGAALVAAIAIVALVPARRSPAPHRAMLAVLPIQDLSPTREEWFADGLTEELITRLGQADPGGLGVIARTSVRRYRDGADNVDVKQVGRELRVDHVLTGSVRRGPERARIAVQLVRVADESQVWSATFDRGLGDAVAVQDAIAREVAAAILPRFSPPAARRAPDAAAHESLLRGRYLAAKGTPDALRSAVDAFQAAVDREPSYAEAHAALAETLHLYRMRASLPPRDVYPRAERAARRAVELDPASAEAHTALAAVQLWYRWDAEGARRSLERALALNPSLAAAHHDLAFLLADDAPDAAIASIRRAQELDPLSPRANVDVGWVYIRTRRFGDALSQCKRTLEVEPGFAGAEACVEQAYLRLGRDAEAFAFTRRSLARAGMPPGELAALDALPPRQALERARRYRLGRLLESSRSSYVSPYNLAVEQAALGEREAALASLDAALGARETMLYRIDRDPAFDGLRSDPRFVAFARRARDARSAAADGTP